MKSIFGMDEQESEHYAEMKLEELYNAFQKEKSFYEKNLGIITGIWKASVGDFPIPDYILNWIPNRKIIPREFVSTLMQIGICKMNRTM